MIKLPIQNYYVRDKLIEHSYVKPLVLEAISKREDHNLVDYSQGEENNIGKLDWDYANDFDRDWVKILGPMLIKKLGEMAYTLGFESIVMKQMWYQQYQKGNIHDWHTHSENYTGVYYLEYPDGAPATQLYDTEMKAPDVNEGDIVMFPSMTPHRAPKVKNDIKKTIVSFNFNVLKIHENKLKEFKNA